MSELNERYVVFYTEKDCIDDLDLMRAGGRRAYFPTREEAKEFADKHRFKNRLVYWQPSIHKETRRIIQTYVWEASRGNQG